MRTSWGLGRRPGGTARVAYSLEKNRDRDRWGARASCRNRRLGRETDMRQTKSLAAAGHRALGCVYGLGFRSVGTIRSSHYVE